MIPVILGAIGGYLIGTSTKEFFDEGGKIKLGESSYKNYNINYGVGNSKYVVSFHDGEKTNKDGSPFYDVKIFKSKNEMNKFIAKLNFFGYKEKINSYDKGGEMKIDVPILISPEIEVKAKNYDDLKKESEEVDATKIKIFYYDDGRERVEIIDINNYDDDYINKLLNERKINIGFAKSPNIKDISKITWAKGWFARDGQVTLDGEFVSDYDFESDINTFWVRDFRSGGEKGFSSPEELFQYLAKRKKLFDSNLI